MAWLYRHGLLIFQCAFFLYTLPVWVRMAREGQFRRIWTWPMRVGVAGFALLLLLPGAAGWGRTHSLVPASWGGALNGIEGAAFAAGFLGLSVWLVGFLRAMARDLRGSMRRGRSHPGA